MTETGEAQHVIRARREKLQRLRELGVEPYAYRFEPSCSAADAKLAFSNAGEATEVNCRLAGRIRSLRPHGKTTFGDIEDRSGKIQLYFRQDVLGDRGYELAQLLDLGDWIGVEGQVFRTRAGEVTVRVERIELLAKTVRPLPFGKEETDEAGQSVIHGGFSDVESRYRQR